MTVPSCVAKPTGFAVVLGLSTVSDAWAAATPVAALADAVGCAELVDAELVGADGTDVELADVAGAVGTLVGAVRLGVTVADALGAGTPATELVELADELDAAGDVLVVVDDAVLEDEALDELLGELLELVGLVAFTADG